MFPEKQKFQQGRGVGLSNPKILVLLLFQKYYFIIFRHSWTGITNISRKERWILCHTHTYTRLDTHTHTYTHTHTHTHTHAHTHFSILWSAPSTVHIWISFPSGFVMFVMLCTISTSIIIIISFSYLNDLLVFSGYFSFWFLIGNIRPNKCTILGKYCRCCNG